MRLKRNEYRLIEERIKALNDDKYHLTQEHIDEVLARAHDELLRREKARIARQEARKRRLRRVVVGSAAIVSVLVVFFVYSALAPVTVGSANNFVRRASIWINDKLRLGVTFTEPVDDEAKREINGYTTFDTLEDAAKQLKAPVIYLENSNDLTISSISANNTVANGEFFTLEYNHDDVNISVLCYPISESGFISLEDDSYAEIETKIGNVYMTEVENGVRGTAAYQNYIITIKSNLDKNAILPYVQNLNVFN